MNSFEALAPRAHETTTRHAAEAAPLVLVVAFSPWAGGKAGLGASGLFEQQRALLPKIKPQ